MYQVWALTTSFALKSAICAMYVLSFATNSQARLHITAPTTRISLSRTLFKSSDAMADSLVVADDNVSEEDIDYAATNLSQSRSQFSEIGKRQDFLRPSLDWQSMFQRMYMDALSYDTLDSSLKSFESMSELVDSVSHFIGQRSENDTLPVTSL